MKQMNHDRFFELPRESEDVVIVHQYPLSGSGSCVYTVALAQTLLAAGNRVRVIARRHPNNAQVDLEGIDLVEFDGPQGVTYPRSDCPRARHWTEFSHGELTELQSIFHRHLTQAAADGFHRVLANHVAPSVFLLGDSVRQTGQHLTVISHGTDVEYLLAKSEVWVERTRANLGAVDRLIALTKMNRERLLGFLPTQAAKTDVLPVGVHPASRSTTKSIGIVFTGRQLVDKGIHCLLGGIALVNDPDEVGDVVIAGDGPHRRQFEACRDALIAEDVASYFKIVEQMCAERGELSRGWLAASKTDEIALERRVKRSDVKEALERVRFVGQVPHSEAVDLSSRAQLAAVCSLAPEAFPMAALESLAVGTLPILSEAGGLKMMADRYREDGLQRLIVNADAPLSSMAKAIEGGLHASRHLTFEDIQSIVAEEELWPSVAAALIEQRSVRAQAGGSEGLMPLAETVEAL